MEQKLDYGIGTADSGLIGLQERVASAVIAVSAAPSLADFDRFG